MIFVEDWGASYGSPYVVDLDYERDVEQAGALCEDGPELRFHRPKPAAPESIIAFVDGIRRAEAWLYRLGDDGGSARGLAGAFAVGSVLCDASGASFAYEHVTRATIWGAGQSVSLAPLQSWSWHSISVPSTDPDAPLEHLQKMMRAAEGRLASELSEDGTLTIIDGPLDYVAERAAHVVGHVKTHHRAFLPPDLHAHVPELAVAERTSLFSLEDRYSCYLRIAAPGPYSGPWSGIVRLHLPGEAGVDVAASLADRCAREIPRFAGIPHRDARAPQNLQPVGALETRLRHLMGDVQLATRAVRDAVRRERVA